MRAETQDTGQGVTINLRADRRKRALIDRAAAAVGKNRSEFMLDAACREATSVLLDQRFFTLDEKTFERFRAALDRPPADNPRLHRLLSTKAPWQR
jgi:uncharacterized protein (DUF1778 family)